MVWARYREGLPVLLGLGLALAVLWALAESMVLPAWRGISPVERQLQQIAAKCRAAQKGEAGRPIGVIVGNSGSMDGYLLDQLEASTGFAWMNLAQPCRSYQQLETTLFPFFESGLRPRYLIFGSSAMLLAEKPRRRSLQALHDIVAAQLMMAAVVVQGEGYAADTAVRPFASVVRSHGPSSEEGWQSSLSQLQEDERLEASHYAADNAEARALQSILRRCRQTAEALVVVKMPEGSRLRSVIPESAYRLEDRLLAEALPGVPVLDARGLLSDEDFVDQRHQNEDGRRRLTAELLQVLHSER